MRDTLLPRSARGTTSIVLAMLLVALVPRAGMAQPEEDPRKQARMHVGPVYFTPGLSLTNLGIDTNVFNEAVHPKRDFTFTVTPRVEAWMVFTRRATVRAAGNVDLVYFRTYESERSVDPGVAVRPEVYFNRLTLFGEASFLRTRQRPNFEIDARAERTERAVRAGLSYRLFPKLALELSGRDTRIRFDADAVFLGTYLDQVLNRTERVGQAALRYRYSALTSFVSTAEAIRDEFPKAPARNVDSVRVMGGAVLQPRAIISGSAFLGARRMLPRGVQFPGFSLVAASVGLGSTLFGATRLGFLADRDVSYSFEVLYPYYVRTGFGASVRQALGRRLDLRVGGQRYGHTYRDFAGREVRWLGVPRVDVVRILDAGVGFRLKNRTLVTVGASYWERTSNLQLFRDYRGLRAGLSVEQGF